MSDTVTLLDTETGEQYEGDDAWEALNDFLGTGPTLRVMMSGDYAAVERITGGCLMLSGCQEH
jgi:hypothetical protein